MQAETLGHQEEEFQVLEQRQEEIRHLVRSRFARSCVEAAEGRQYPEHTPSASVFQMKEALSSYDLRSYGSQTSLFSMDMSQFDDNESTTHSTASPFSRYTWESKNENEKGIQISDSSIVLPISHKALASQLTATYSCATVAGTSVLVCRIIS